MNKVVLYNIVFAFIIGSVVTIVLTSCDLHFKNKNEDVEVKFEPTAEEIKEGFEIVEHKKLNV